MKYRNLPVWVKGGIRGAVFFLVVWNILFLLAYLFGILGLWDFLFYISYPIMSPIVKLTNILFGTCYSATRCFGRLPFIFILMTFVEGFIVGSVVQYFKEKVIRKSKKKYADGKSS